MFTHARDRFIKENQRRARGLRVTPLDTARDLLTVVAPFPFASGA
jgi:hypothetical protein